MPWVILVSLGSVNLQFISGLWEAFLVLVLLYRIYFGSVVRFVSAVLIFGSAFLTGCDPIRI